MYDIDEDKDNGVCLKLSDFGWACQYFSEKRMTLCGTPECIIYTYIRSTS